MMKTNLLAIAVLINAGLMLLSGKGYGQMPNPEELARRLVTHTINIQPGELVTITGDVEQIPLMEMIATEVIKKGGFPYLVVNSEKVALAGMRDVPEEHLTIQHKAFHKFKSDAAIHLSSKIDYGALEKQVPADYLAKFNQAKESVDKEEEENLWNKLVYLNLPTRREAEHNKLDYETFQQMQWAAINADYAALAANARQLENLLRTGKKVRITAPGTKLTFNLRQGPVGISDGVVSPEEAASPVKAGRYLMLPDGIIRVVADEQSASGKVFVPRDRCGNVAEVRLTNASFNFVKGKVQDFKAETGQECIEAHARKEPAFLQFSGFTIGLNPALKVLSNDTQDFRPWNAEGLVHIMIGGNTWYGGNNKIADSFGFPIEKATVEIDGKTIIKDGKMVWSSLASK